MSDKNDFGKFEHNRDRIARNTIDRCVQNEMKHNEKAGIRESEETVRKRYVDIAHKAEAQKGAVLYKDK